jgi:acyl-CoA synthetase (AMP-forming)/AMP-acid ligase II
MAWMGHLIEGCRQRYPDRTAVIEGERQVTFTELEDRSARLASALLACGIRHGDRVGVLSRNRLEIFETYLALGRIGAILVPINNTLVPREMHDIVQRCGISTVLGEEDLMELLAGSGATALHAYESPEYRAWTTSQERRTLPTLQLSDSFAILHTSATTGQSKGVVVDQRSLSSMATGYLATAGLEPGMVFLNCFQLCHGAMVQPFMELAQGATVVVQRAFTPQGCLEELERTRTTHLWVVPEMLKFILRSRSVSSTDFSSLRQVMYAAAPLPRMVLDDAALKLGCDFRQIYGMTEGGGPMATAGPAEHRQVLQSDPGGDHVVPSGRPCWGVSMRVFTEAGEPLPIGEVGEVCVRSDGNMRCYWENPAATAEVVRNGWLRTGDMGFMDDAGYVYLVGRLKEMIMRSGQQVFPAEVEKALLEHPKVAEAGVVGVPDPDWGETPFAFVVAKPEAPLTVQELNQFLVTRLASYKRPSRIEVVEELPRGQVGKLLRRVLRERALKALEG